MPPLPVISDVSIEDMHRDPTSVYARLRQAAPVALLEATGRVLLTRAEDVRAAKANPDIWCSEDTTTPAERAFQATSMMRKDGPQHIAERMAIQPGLSARKIKTDWRQSAEAHAHTYLDRLETGQVCDLFADVAAPYAGAVLRDVLGLQGATADDLVRWSQVLIDGAGNVAQDEDVFARCDVVNDEINKVIDANLARIATQHDGSVLSTMAEKSELDRIRCNIKVSIGGGVNEPRDAFLTAVFALLTHPEQLADVVADTSLFSRAFEEAVRWVAPIQTSPRKSRVPVVMHGVELPANTRVSVIQASANLDEEHYKNAAQFDIHRAETRHFSFGSGSHFCMGAHLSRMSVGEVLLPRIFERFPNMVLENQDAVEWYGFTFRGPLSLCVKL